VSIDEVSRAIGELNANVKTLMVSMRNVESTVSEINRDGCGPCREHETRITTIERKNGNGKLPIKQVMLWASGAGAFISGLIAGVVELKKALLGP
jgi:hypothetical protein